MTPWACEDGSLVQWVPSSTFASNLYHKPRFSAMRLLSRPRRITQPWSRTCWTIRLGGIMFPGALVVVLLRRPLLTWVSFESGHRPIGMSRLTTIGRPHARPCISADTSCGIVALMDSLRCIGQNFLSQYPCRTPSSTSVAYPVNCSSHCEPSCCQALVASPATGAASPKAQGSVRKDW